MNEEDEASQPLRNYLQANLSAHFAIPPEQAQDVKAADSFGEAVQAGWQMSTLGLLKRQKLPDLTLPENSNRLYRIASQAATLAGDLPAMMVGGFIGGGGGAATGAAEGAAAGSVVPGPGTAAGGAVGATLGGTIGAGVGAFAAPAMMRRFLMDAYQKGGVKDFSEFWDRSSAILYDGIKQGAVGGLAGAAGFGAKAAAGTVAGVTAELGTMLAAGNAVEGRFRPPSFDEFTDAALLMGAVHGATAATSWGVGKLRGATPPEASPVERKLMEKYALDGTHPMDEAQAAAADPEKKAQYLSSEEPMPAKVVGPLPPPEVATPVDANVLSAHEVLGEEGAVPAELTAAQVVPGYVPVFGPEQEQGPTKTGAIPDRAQQIDTYYDRLRGGKELIRFPFSTVVAFDPRTDTVVNSKTDAVEISPAGIPEGDKAERPGRVILHNEREGSWVDKATGETVIPSRQDTPQMKRQEQVEEAKKELASTKGDFEAASKAAAKSKAAMEKGAQALAARTKPATAKMLEAQTKRADALKDAESKKADVSRFLRDVQDRHDAILAARPDAEATPQDLAAMSEPDLRARVQAGEDAGSRPQRQAATNELLSRVEPPPPPEAPTGGAAATPAPRRAPASPDQVQAAQDAILDRVSFNEPTKKTPFLTTMQRLYTNVVDKLEPIFAMDKLLNGGKLSRAQSRMLASKSTATSGAHLDMATNVGVPRFGADGVANEPFSAPLKAVSTGEFSQKEYVAVAVAKRVLELSRQVEKARGTPFAMQKGDRFQLFDAKGAKSGEGTIVAPGVGTDQVRVRVQGESGGPETQLLPREDVRRNLIALVNGREVRNVGTGVDLENAQILVDAKGAKYQEIGERFRKWQRAVVQYGVDAKYIPAERAKAFLDSADYIPLHRVMEADFSSPLRSIEGSEREIVNPLESMLKDAQFIFRKADENAARLELYRSVKANPEAADGLVREVEKEQAFGTISESDFRRLTRDTITDLTPNDITVLTQADHALQPNQMTLRDDAGLHILEGPQELIDAYKGMGHQEMSGIMKLLTLPAKLERGGIVNSLSFLVRHGIRNPLMARMFSENNTGFMDIFRALGAYATKNEDYQNAMSAGALTGGVVKGFNDRGVLQAELSKLAPETGMFNATWNLARNALETMHVLATVSDNAIRLAEYQNAIKGGKGRLQAAYEARNVIPDSQRVGAQMRGLNALIPFLHMHLQGLDKIGQMVAKEGPLSVGMRLAPLMYASAALWWASKDDSRMQDISHEQRDLFWVIPTTRWEGVSPDDSDAMANAMARPEDQRRISADGLHVEVNNGAIFRIPKPFEAGIVIGSGTERILEAFAKNNPNAWDGFGHSVVGGVLPNYIPAFAKPVLEQFANKSTFTGNPLISAQAEKELPQYRYGDYTTELAKALGKIIAPVPGIGQTNLASPTIIENYIQSYGGYIGSYALELADSGLRKAGLLPDPVRPEDTLADIPFVRAFVIRNPGANTQPLHDFYAAYDHHQQIVNSIRAKAAEGDDAELEKLQLIETRDQAAGTLDGMEKSLVNMSHLIRMINKMPDMTPREKRQQIDGLYYGMNEVAKLGLNTMHDVAKEMETAQ